MGKIFKSKQVVTVFSIIICFAILLFAYRYRVDKAINAISVPVATRDLLARELITNSGEDKSFETVKVASSMLTANVITKKNNLVGTNEKDAKYVNYNTFIPKGSMFYESAVTTWSHMPDSAWADIEDGYTLFSLSVTPKQTYGNSIFPGDKIDLFFQSTDDAGKWFMGPLTKGITVLAVKDTHGRHIFKRSASQREAKELIFQVPDEEFLFMKAANKLGDIIPVPRNANYNPEKEESIVNKNDSYIANYIRARSKLSQGDVVSSNTAPVTNNKKTTK